MDDHQRRLLRAVEEIAAMLTDFGMPRMAARVFAYALAEDADSYTAADFAAGLQISPAAVSGAVRYLVTARLVFKERVPGSRADVFRVHEGDVWTGVYGARAAMLDQWERTIADAAETVGRDTKGGRRLTETEEFFRFFREESVAMMQRWQERHAALVSEREA